MSLENTICLNMIVKNEKHIIRDTLDNLTNYIKFSYWVISDTGSTDGTQEFIKDYFREKNIPGELFEDKWQDFAYNRNRAIEHAFNKSDYLFFFDADDLIHGDFKLPDKLEKDTYQFKFGTGFSYHRISLINNREKIAKYLGVLYELLNVYKPNFTNEFIDGEYHFESRRLGDRSKNPNKYKNDAEVLEKAFDNENIDLGLKYRYAYYCGQSYRDANLTEKSIEWFKIYLDLPADNQYKYCACDNLGNNYKKLNNMEEALNYWYKAISFDRERRETVVKIMEYYFSKGNNFAINMLYEKMKNYKLTNPNGRIFLDMTSYHDIDYYNSIASCYIGEWMSGYYSCKNLLLNNKRIEITLQNFTCYGYNMHLDKDNKPFLDKLLELFEKYFDTKKELVKKLWNMVSKNIKEYLPEQVNESNELLIILNNYNKTSAWAGHMQFANWIVDLIKPKIVADLGVDHGHSTFAFASSKIGHVYGVDCFEGDEHAGFRNTEQDVNNFKKELIDKNLLIDNITFIKGYFIDIYKTFDKEIDILHIDGLHNYENVKEDYETWVTKTHDNSIILFHDVITFSNTVGKFFQEIPYPKFYFTHCHGLGVVCKNFNLLRKLYYSPNIPYKENIIFKEKKNYCFIHSCNIKETGTKTLDYLIDKINKSGLINNLDKIFINNIGIPIENVYGDKFEINNYSSDNNLFELPTINIIQDFSEKNSDCNILYLHTKGISHVNNSLFQQNNIKNWIDMMLYFLVENFELCIDKLNNNDAVGCNYYTTPREAYHLACKDHVTLNFSGNFWWSKSNFIKTLPKLDITENINKYDAELWLCKNNPKVHVLHNSHTNHYYWNYPRERYVKKKINVSKEYQFNKLDDKYN